MKRIIKNIVLLFGAALSLSACGHEVAFYATEVKPVTSEGEVVSYYEEATPVNSSERISYTDFKRLDSHADLIYQDGFKNVFETYEEAMAYKNVLEKNLEIDGEVNEEEYDYIVKINYIDSFTPGMFEKRKLFITNSWEEASYNKDSCSLEGIYLKDDVLYIHRNRHYLNKAMDNFWVKQCYTFFIDKNITFTSYKIETTNLFKY